MGCRGRLRIFVSCAILVAACSRFSLSEAFLSATRGSIDIARRPWGYDVGPVPAENEWFLESVADGLNAEHGAKAPPALVRCSEASCNLSMQCLSSHDLVYLRDRGVTNDDQVARLCPDVIRRQEVDTRCKPRDNSDDAHTKLTQAEVWGYGLLSVTIISLCSMSGILLLPIMGKKLYKQILSFFIALGVGSLAGSAVFHLIPQALGMVEYDPDQTFLWKMILAASGIYVFFLADIIMKIHLGNKQMRKEAKHGARILHNESTASSLNQTPSNNVVGLKIIRLPEEKNGHIANHDHTLVLEAEPAELSHGHTHGTFDPEENVIAAVAWMIIFGDGLHNFVDGLSLGAAFADDLWIGISISIAVFCEEFPHELGDFAILLRSGMSMKQAAFFNGLSALTCYLGLVVGILLGELEDASVYIFAFAGGMFLYISLSAMMPEMGQDLEEAVKEGGAITVMLLQNSGLILGAGLMFVMSKWSHKINLAN